MKFIKKIILVLIFILPISNSFGAMVTHNQTATVSVSSGGIVAGVEFNNDGTKMFTSYGQMNNGAFYIEEYNLSTPYDISTRVSAGDSERCELTGTEADNNYTIYDLEFSSDGMKFFTLQRKASSDAGVDRVYGFDLTSPYDVSTCALATSQLDLDTTALTTGSNAGDFDHTRPNSLHRVQSVEINDDGTKLFLLFFDDEDSDVGGRLYEYNLSTPYDVSTLSLVLTAGIAVPDTTSGVDNPSGMKFSSDGKRIFIVGHDSNRISQISLNKAYDTSSFTLDGGVSLFDGMSPNTNHQARGVTFSANGLKLYIGNDRNQNNLDQIMEYDLVCPFNIIEGKCPPVTENSVRTGMAEAQIMIAKSTIDHSTKSALNRLRWIRRNKDTQNLTNLNIGFDFNNQMLTTLTKAVKTSADSKKIKDKDKQQDIFFWSEGSIAVGRVGDTNISSFKKIGTEAITLGADKFTDNNGIKGLAFRMGNNNVDVGMGGSNIDTDTFNLSYYSTSQIGNDTKFEDIVIGFGKLKFDMLTVLDGKHIKASRNGRQVYAAVKSKDEIKKNNFILIPSIQADVGHTILDGYTESGIGAIKVKDQNIQTLKLRTAMGVVDDLPNESTFCPGIKNKTCFIKRHGKLEYMADLSRSSNFKYTYASDQTLEFNEKLYSGALHNLNGELGIDIILPDSFSIFLIYERNQALGTGHTDNIIITIGYLPNKKTNYAFKLAGSENLGSEFKISKNINDFEIDFKLNNQDVLRPNTFDEATINLKKIF